jgi:cytochrome c-type biogenesis protein CcmH
MLVLAISYPAASLAAVQPDEMLANPLLEARARALSQQLRCMVCQNESIDESDAPLAHDLRVLVRERLQTGDSDAQVLDFLVARYGEFVLLKPRLSWRTAVLWGLPPGLLLGGMVLLLVAARRRRSRAQEPAARLTAAEEARLRKLLAEGGS